jgi:IS30 family transposase
MRSTLDGVAEGQTMALPEVAQRTAQAVQDQIHQLLLPVIDKVHTLTSDHGKEFACHEQIAEMLNLTLFRTSLCCLGARHQRKHKWFTQTIFSKAARLSSGISRRD